jgi:hypothetical protein
MVHQQLSEHLSAMKTAACQRANTILNNNFTKDPGFRISATANTVPG